MMLCKSVCIRIRNLLLAAFLLPIACVVYADAAVVISVPGPGSTVGVPLAVAKKIGADRAEGLELRLRYVDGGGVAMNDLAAGNADFAVFALPAAIGKNAKGGQLVAIAATDNLAPWILVVRSTLRGKIKRPADLAGRVIGVHSSSLSTKTASQQVAELALSKNGIAPDSVRFISTGQSWESISAALRNGSADAVMIEEPFATRAEQEGLGYAIFNSLMQDKAPSIPGAKFLRGALLAERRKVTDQPGLAAQAVRMIKRSLIWIHSHGSEELVNLLDLKGREREAFLAAMQRYRDHYSTDGKFSSVQLQETDRFFRALNPSSSAMTLHPAEDMIIDTWSGRKP